MTASAGAPDIPTHGLSSLRLSPHLPALLRKRHPMSEVIDLLIAVVKCVPVFRYGTEWRGDPEM